MEFPDISRHIHCKQFHDINSEHCCVCAVQKAFRLRELFRTASIVGIGLFASLFLVQADEETDKALEVLALYVANSGSIGFEVDFDVAVPWEEIHYFDEFHLIQDGYDDKVDDGISPQ